MRGIIQEKAQKEHIENLLDLEQRRRHKERMAQLEDLLHTQTQSHHTRDGGTETSEGDPLPSRRHTAATVNKSTAHSISKQRYRMKPVMSA